MNVITVGKSKGLLHTFPVHKHGYWELVYNFKGSGTMTIDNVDVPFNEGELIVIPPGISHGKASEEGFMDISMMIKDMRPIGIMKPQRIVDDEAKSLYTLMNMAEMVYMNPSGYSEKHNSAIINSLGEAIFQLMSGLFDIGLKLDLRVESFIKHLEENISNADFDLAGEMDRTGYSNGYFRKVFKKEIGMSPVQYFNSIRIRRAKELILLYGPSRSLKDIALECGYTDPYYFSRVFKTVSGQSPTEYRETGNYFDMDNVDHEKLRVDLHVRS